MVASKSRKKKENYPRELIVMLMDRGDKTIPEVLPDVYKKFPKFKTRLTKKRAQAMAGWYRQKGWEGNEKGASVRKATNGKVPFAKVGVRIKKRMLVMGMELKEEGKTPSSIRDTLMDRFEEVLLPPSLELSKLISRFSKDGVTPNGNGNGSSVDSQFPFTVHIKGPGTDVTRGIQEETSNELLAFLFGGDEE